MESQHRMAVMAANIRYTAAKSGFCSRPRTDMTMHHHLALVPFCLGAALAAGPLCAQDVDAPAPLIEWPVALRETIDMRLELEPGETAAQIGEEMAPEVERMLDTALAMNIAATGQYTGFSVESWMPGAANGRDIVVNGVSHGKNNMFPDPGVKFQDLGKYDLGNAKRVAVAVQQRFADSRNLAANLKLRHMSGPVDVQVDVKGNKSLINQNPMRFSYSSSAFYQLNSALALGMVARGDLGTLDDFAPAARHDAGAVARLKLLGKNSALSVETGYDMRLGPGSAAQPSRTYANLNFNWKL